MKKIVMILLAMSSLNCFSQGGTDPFIDNMIRVPNMPESISNHGIHIPNSGNLHSSAIQQQSNRLIQQAERELAQRQQHQQQERQLIAKNLLMNGFASFADKYPAGTSCFYNAFAEIDSMLNGTKELSIARSVFLVENAFYENTLNYSDYQSFIKHKAEFCNRIIKESRQNPSDNLAKNMAIFRLLTEKVPFKNSRKEKTEYHLPLQYDYYDYQSRENYDSQFITKLMGSNIGQCYSMPLYYLILAEAINAEACWSLSPKHGLVKIRDRKGNWHNIELTCKSILSDAHYTNNSYIKAKALRNKIYLEPLDKKQIIACQLLSLAQAYCEKYGFDDFYLKCVNSVPQYIPNSVDALKMRASYFQNLLIHTARLLNKPDLQSFGNLQPLADKTLEQLEACYREIDDLGYEEIPDVIYENWLQYVEKQKLVSDKNRTVLLNEIR
ncbi:MAG: hypothetical protein LBL18_04590 [Bacteroidales bacterium]|jgi:hypothetical protein|nr:hypothetical protein [Bacteroidales bacterium]